VDTNPGAQDNPYVYANATGFRMLTNAEWECAARYQGDSSAYGAYEYPVGSGYWWTPGNYASGATANYKDEEATSVVASSTPSFTYKMTVKTKKANVLGLYDMSGGIFIWCFDEYKKSGNRLVHGGSYNGPYTENPLTSLQIGCKKYSFPDGWHGMFMNRGFRLAKTAD
jgi:formylglycine-generating enzyme required for sulfatase activity